MWDALSRRKNGGCEPLGAAARVSATDASSYRLQSRCAPPLRKTARPRREGRNEIAVIGKGRFRRCQRSRAIPAIFTLQCPAETYHAQTICRRRGGASVLAGCGSSGPASRFGIVTSKSKDKNRDCICAVGSRRLSFAGRRRNEDVARREGRVLQRRL